MMMVNDGERLSSSSSMVSVVSGGRLVVAVQEAAKEDDDNNKQLQVVNTLLSSVCEAFKIKYERWQSVLLK